MRSSEWSSQNWCCYNMRKRHHSSLSPCEDTANKWLHVSQEESPPYNPVSWHPDYQTSILWNCGKINLYCSNQTKPNLQLQSGNQNLTPAWLPCGSLQKSLFLAGQQAWKLQVLGIAGLALCYSLGFKEERMMK